MSAPRSCCSRDFPRHRVSPHPEANRGCRASPRWSPNPKGSSKMGGLHPLPTLTDPFCSAGEGGLEVRGHGDRPHLPLDVHHRLLAGHRGALPPALLGGDDLGARPGCRGDGGRCTLPPPGERARWCPRPAAPLPLPGRTRLQPRRTLGWEMQGEARAVLRGDLGMMGRDGSLSSYLVAAVLGSGKAWHSFSVAQAQAGGI